MAVEPQAALLWLVPTPIGNLGDLTIRAVEVLRSADAIVAEDTRRARALLSHLAIRGKAVHRLDAHRERSDATRWAERIAAGQRVALLSDAGMPGVSDPGALLVRECVARGILVQALPGPSAVTTAVAVSGLCSGGFTFTGFLPRAKAERERAMAALAAREEAVVLFESPRRLAGLLEGLAERSPQRDAVVCRELSKVHEEVIRGSLHELSGRAAAADWRGEITLVLGPAPMRDEPRWPAARVDEQLRALRLQGFRPKDAARALSADSGWSVRELYERLAAVRSGAQ